MTRSFLYSVTVPGVLVVPPPLKESNLQTHYDELLRVIGEVGKDIKPAYTNSKVSADRLKRSELRTVEQD